MWKILTKKEVEEFQKHALETYIIGEEINPTWHPVVQAVCFHMNFNFWLNMSSKYTKEKE